MQALEKQPTYPWVPGQRLEVDFVRPLIVTGRSPTGEYILKTWATEKEAQDWSEGKGRAEAGE